MLNRRYTYINEGGFLRVWRGKVIRMVVHKRTQQNLANS